MTNFGDTPPLPLDGLPAAPDLIAPVHGFRDWRATDAGLCSPRTDAVWTARTQRGRCRPRSADDFVRDRHPAPGRGCNCGIHAYYRFSPEFSKVDHLGVSGVVTVWGHVEAHRDGMRAEYARVEVLGVYSRWTRRQKDAVRAIGERLGVELVDLYDLPDVAHAYGSPMPSSLIPGGTRPKRRITPAPAERRERLVIVGR